jgi:hypothetical protein
MVCVQLHGHPWIIEEHWPTTTPAPSTKAARNGSGSAWFWPPVRPRTRQLRVTVSTVWEGARALVGIPGR